MNTTRSKPWPTARRATLALLTALTLLGMVAGSALAAPSYTVTDLGTLTESPSSGAEAINESGQIVGWSGSGPDAGDTRGFIWQDGEMTDLGAFGDEEYSRAFDVNGSAQVVGESSYPVGPNGNGATKAFRWQNGQMTDLGALLAAPDEESHAYATNDSGQVVGKSKAQDQTGGFWDHAFLYSGGTMKDLGTLGPSGSPGESVAYGINASGQVVGEADLEDFGGTHAFLWENGQMRDLGTLAGSYSVAYDINDNGQVVGESASRGFLWQSGAMTELVGITPSAINDSGQVVGSACIFDGGEEGCSDRARTWENGQTSDLNDLIDPASGWTLREATDVNDAGQIVGTGEVNGETHAFLLTPDPDAPPADTTEPTLNLPANIIKDATGPGGAAVVYAATATDAVDGSVPVECSPASSTTFPIGTTTVNCTATDAAGNTASGNFTVTVKGASEQIGDLKNLVASLNLKAGTNTSLQAKLDDALAAIGAGDKAAACTALGDFINQVNAQAGKKISQSDVDGLITSATRFRTVLGCQ